MFDVRTFMAVLFFRLGLGSSMVFVHALTSYTHLFRHFLLAL